MMNLVVSSPSASIPNSLVGEVRRFGPHGVLYEVLEVVSAELVRIRVLGTGEITDYRLDEFLKDPEG